MTNDEKNKFDHLNKSSYLFRLNLSRLGFDIEVAHIVNNDVWHVFYRNIIIGTITFRTDENDYTFCNLRLYKYFHQKFPDCDDFLMSTCYVFDEGKMVEFDFKKFDEYFTKLREHAESLVPKDTPGEETAEQETVDDIEDSISRLKEYCEEYDAQFSTNMLFKDIMNLLKENERLHKENAEYAEKIKDLDN